MPGWALFLVRRLLTAIVLLLLLTLITFFAFWKIPNEPAAVLVDLRHATPEQIQHARHILGADRPVWVQYGKFVWRVLHGDLGRSWSSQTGGLLATQQNGEPVANAVLRGAAVTGSVVLGGALLLLLIAVPLGLLSASRPRSWFDRLAVMIGIAGISTHPLVVGLLLQLFVGGRWHLAPQSGYCDLVPKVEDPRVFDPEVACSGPAGWASHLVLPWITFALFFVALYSRMIRARMLEVLGEPYIRTARAKGAGERRVLGRHALPNTVLPLVTMTAMDIGTAVGIATYIEAVYRLPGLGFETIRALSGVAADLPVLIGIVLFTGTVIIALNFLVDVVAVALDPTIGQKPGGRASLAEGRLT
jgi:peptide/nickel transport system permease protein